MTDQPATHDRELATETGRSDTSVAPTPPPPPPPYERGGIEAGAEPGILDRKVAFYSDVKMSTPCDHPPLRQVLHRIATGEYDATVSKIRGLRSTEELLPEGPARLRLENERLALKHELPAFSISCDAENRKRSVSPADREIKPTRMMQVDLDHLSAVEVEETRKKLESLPSVAFVYKSPSGSLKAGVCIDGAGDPARHKAAFTVASGIISKLTGHEMDRQTSDFQRLCYMSFDPDLYINETPEMLVCEVEGVNVKTVIKGLITFDRHHTLLAAAIMSRRAGRAKGDIRKELDTLAAQCSRDVPESEIGGILKWVLDKIDPTAEFDVSDPDAWPKPTPLPDGLPAVLPLAQNMVPDVVRRYASDIAERMQCPVEFAIIAIVVGLGSVIGRQVAIRPKENDDWEEVPNLWGFAVGNPGMLKSPATKAALGPVFLLEKDALRKYNQQLEGYEDDLARAQPRIKALKTEVDHLLADGDAEAAKQKMDELLEAEPEKPVRKRFVVHDPTVERLLEILAESPNGQIWIRDELAGLLRNLERKGREGDRTFLLECWNGSGSYSTDRIGRGNTHVEHTIVSIFGTIQPEPLAKYMAGQSREGPGNDGFMQRFQLAVWPDTQQEWVDVDRAPDLDARETILELFKKLTDIPGYYQGLENSGDMLCLHFDADAQKLFKQHRRELELHLRSGREGPALEAHLSKYRGLIPQLALVFHLCQTESGPVSKDALERALRFARCLESHARRIYTFAEVGDLFAARRLADRIRNGELPAAFSARDVYRHNWAGLARSDVEHALEVLIDANWIVPKREQTRGRPQLTYVVSPKLAKMGLSKAPAGDKPASIWPIYPAEPHQRTHRSAAEVVDTANHNPRPGVAMALPLLRDGTPFVTYGTPFLRNIRTCRQKLKHKHDRETPVLCWSQNA